MKNVCVFCGSSRGVKDVYSELALSFAQALAEENLNLIYGGANIGLMKVLADELLEKGGKVYGVMPGNLIDREIAHNGITKMYIVDTMSERKQTMARLSDAFVILPGGVGTMDELFEMMSWNQLGLMKKPLGIFNIDGFFDHLVAFLDHALEEKFLREEHRKNLVVEKHPVLLLKKLREFRFSDPQEWVERLKKLGF
ncbi:MAG: TIGR00730 family Rossman fold protein [Bacteroidales bacterium]